MKSTILSTITGLAATFFTTSSAALVYSVEAGNSTALIAAIEAANASPEADLIELQKGLYSLHKAHGNSEAALPLLTGKLRIIGNGAELRRYSASDFRLLQIADGAEIHIDRLIFAEGSTGAAVNFGKLTCRFCQFIDHSDLRSMAIIENYGELHFLDSEISFNTLANATRDAGTIVNFGIATIRSSRLQGNRLLQANSLWRRFEAPALACALLNYGKAQLDDVLIDENEAGLEYGGDLTGSVVNLGNGATVLGKVIQRGNLPLLQQNFPVAQ